MTVAPYFSTLPAKISAAPLFTRCLKEKKENPDPNGAAWLQQDFDRTAHLTLSGFCTGSLKTRLARDDGQVPASYFGSPTNYTVRVISLSFLGY